MRRVLVLINNTGVGGTERRLGRLFAHMAEEEKDTVFVINRGLWAKLVAGALVPERGARVVRLGEPFGRVAERFAVLKLRRRHTAAGQHRREGEGYHTKTEQRIPSRHQVLHRLGFVSGRRANA